MESEDLLPSSQQPTTGSYRKPDVFSLQIPTLFP